MDPRKHSFPPVVDAQVRLLVLGSLPGERSLAEQRYYAHPQNQFWRLVSPAAGRDLAALDYPARLAALLDAMPDVFTPTDPSGIETAVRVLISAYTSPDIDGGMHLAGELCAFLSRLIRDARLIAGGGREKVTDATVIERALSYIHEHECQNITLQDIADHVHLSRVYFHNLFVAATGRTPHRYLLERRISRARQLLMTTDKPLCEIAADCGFSSQSYFNQVFQKEMGCTPGQYKREMSLRY